MQDASQSDDAQLTRAHTILADLGLTEDDTSSPRPHSGHHSSILVPCRSQDGQRFLLKLFVAPEEGQFYPAGVRIEDYPRREAAFYRYLDSMDPTRHTVPAPKTVLIDHRDPPTWLLLERIPTAIGPAEEVLGIEHVFELLEMIRSIPTDHLLGRRDFPLNRWDVISYLERVRLMYDPVLFVIGERRWTRCLHFFDEALRWNETRRQTVVHGDFTDQNILIDEDGQPYLLDFERIGIGSEDHDFAWFWIHSERNQEWKRQLLQRYWGGRVGSERIRSEWGIRAALAYLALRRLRFSYLTHGDSDPNKAHNLGLLDATLAGGPDLFPV